MPQANWLILIHFVLLWGSVATGLMTGWQLPLSYLVAVPLGIVLWACGLLYNIYNIRSIRENPPLHRTAYARIGYKRIAARTVMNLGIGLACLSWLTLIISFLLIPIYAVAANRRRQYLDYLRTGMQGDAFPDRISKR